MKAAERDALIESYFAEDMKLLKAKGHDYAGEADALGNLRRFGLYGIVVRLSDKFSRLERFAQGGDLKVRDESIRDTLRDIRNYAFLAQIFLDDNGIPRKTYVVRYQDLSDSSMPSKRMRVMACDAQEARDLYVKAIGPNMGPIEEVYPIDEEEKDK